ncbi:hypothetical protein [Maribacter sp. HTCC2170]|uniref:hypothetical protein n=1 Tax=Maribacter sp. (strain HTCC2170 / KCCM 42371) TaxID=313603 RepID=UPI00006AFD4E|nr:hypothetical protein [Maribacter sp. HTCC2170]EAR01178.1 hypothetical protein FB2170_10676 [Maribacter sp. HTCC2170]
MKTKIIYALLALTLVFAVSCNKSDDNDDLQNEALQLPPFESMAIDLGNFLDDSASGKQASTAKVGGNWLYPRLVVGIWNTALFTNLAVPVASFSSAFKHKAEFLGENTWQWEYTVDGFTSEYTARLTGELMTDEVVWKMYVTKAGVGSFDEFLWFSGVSDLDGKSGAWTLYQSHERPNRMIDIEWSIENEEIGSIKYTWVREMNDDGIADTFKDSYLEYGLQEGDYDVFYDLHVYDLQMEDFVDVSIEWNSSMYNGRVMAPSHFEDELWHCWDTDGEDIECE